jgi:DNA invertase Pin-like site-specific DNA recombinase
MSDTPEIVAAYVRCSTDQQADSPEVQRAIIAEFCAKQNYAVPPDLWFVDFAVSAGKPIIERPEGRRLMALATSRRRQFSKVVIVRTDRAFRDINDQESTFLLLGKSGVELVGAKQDLSRETAWQRGMLAIQGVFNQMERQITGERVREHNQARHRKQQQAAGYPSLGLIREPKSDGALTIDPVGLQSAIRVFEVFAAHNGNMRRTLRQLNDEGVPTRRGCRWHGAVLRYTVGAPNYRQCSYYAGEMIHKPDTIPPTIPAELLERVNQILIGMYGTWHVGLKNMLARAYVRTTYSGLVACGECGQPMDYRRERVSTHCGYFTCRGHSGQGYAPCSSPVIPADTLDWMVGNAIRRMLERVLLDTQPTATRRAPTGPNTATALASIEQRRQRALTLYVDGAITRENWEQQTARLDAEAARLSRPPEQAPRPTMTARSVREVLDRWDSLWVPDFDSMTKRDLLSRVLGIGRGGIVAVRIRHGKRLSRWEWIVDVNAPALSDTPGREVYVGLPRTRET